METVVEKVICISKPYIGEYANGCFYNLVRTLDNNGDEIDRMAIKDDSGDYRYYEYYSHCFMSLDDFRQSKLDILCI